MEKWHLLPQFLTWSVQMEHESKFLPTPKEKPEPMFAVVRPWISFLFTLDLKRKTWCLTLLRINKMWHAVTQRQTSAWMSLAGQWMDRHFGGREARPVVITHLALWWKVKQSLFLFSTTTNSTLIDQVVFVEMHLKMADRWNESIFNDHRPHTTAYHNPTTMLEWI